MWPSQKKNERTLNLCPDNKRFLMSRRPAWLRHLHWQSADSRLQRDQSTVQHDENQPVGVVVHRVVLLDLGTQFGVATHGHTTNVPVTARKVRVFNR